MEPTGKGCNKQFEGKTVRGGWWKRREESKKKKYLLMLYTDLTE